MATKTNQTSQTDLILFGIRWLIPLAILADTFIRAAPNQRPDLPVEVLGLVLGAVVFNLLFFLVRSAGVTNIALDYAVVVGDVVIALVAVALRGPAVVWVALMPVVGAGAQFGLWPGLGVAAAMAIGAFIAVLAGGDTLGPAELGALVMSVLLLPVAGVASGALSDARAVRPGGDQAERALRDVREQMHVIYDMASTLSSSLNYNRVLDMVMDVCVHGLERMGMGTTVSAAILLFTEEGDDVILKVASERRLTPADTRATVRGVEGVIGQAFSQAEPVVATNPHDDPELKYFGAFRGSGAVLCIPMRANFESYGVLLLGIPAQRRFREDHIRLMQVIANQAIASLQNASLFQNLAEERDRIIDVDEEARKQLARDLHDGPTQTVSAVAMRLGFVRRLLDKSPEKVADELAKIEEMARRAASEIRHMLFILRPLVLESQGIVPALEQIAQKMIESHNQKMEIQAQPGIEDILDDSAKATIFYIVEEAANNARKHAKSEVITVRLSRKQDVVLVEIIDRGKGFDLEAVQEDYDQRGSLGMINLRERAALVEGTMHIDTAPGKGTTVSLVIPLERKGGKLPTAKGTE